MRKLRNAMVGSHGIISNVADAAKCSPRTVSRKLKKYPELQELLEEEKATFRSEMNDMADMVIFKALKDDDRRVAMWVKERLGASEGYNPALELKGGVSEQVTLNFIDKEGAAFEGGQDKN